MDSCLCLMALLMQSKSNFFLNPPCILAFFHSLPTWHDDSEAAIVYTFLLKLLQNQEIANLMIGDDPFKLMEEITLHLNCVEFEDGVTQSFLNVLIQWQIRDPQTFFQAFNSLNPKVQMNTNHLLTNL